MSRFVVGCLVVLGGYAGRTLVRSVLRGRR